MIKIFLFINSNKFGYDWLYWIMTFLYEIVLKRRDQKSHRFVFCSKKIWIWHVANRPVFKCRRMNFLSNLSRQHVPIDVILSFAMRKGGLSSHSSLVVVILMNCTRTRLQNCLIKSNFTWDEILIETNSCKKTYKRSMRRAWNVCQWAVSVW